MNLSLPGNASAEIAALRQELLLRILLQNVLLHLMLIIFVALAGLAILFPAAAWALDLAFQCATLAAALQWCHHGIRTKQIKQFLNGLAPDIAGLGWETWLPGARPRTLLGSRWMISTKGVFLGLGLAMMAAHLALPAVVTAGAVTGAAVLWLTSAAFLLSNPKE